MEKGTCGYCSRSIRINEQDAGKTVYCVNCLEGIRKWQDYLKTQSDTVKVLDAVEQLKFSDRELLTKLGQLSAGALGMFVMLMFILPSAAPGILIAGFVSYFILEPLVFKGENLLMRDVALNFVPPFVLGFLFGGLLTVGATGWNVLWRFPAGLMVGLLVGLGWIAFRFEDLKHRAVHMAVAAAETLKDSPAMTTGGENGVS